jgi:carbon monoxide dehydrogenase subunit G
MRKLMLVVFILSTVFLSNGCDKISELFEGENEQDPNELSGDANVAIGQVGNTFSAPTVYVAGQAVSIPHTITIVKNESGVATINVKVPLSTIKNQALYQQYKTEYNLDELINKIPATAKDADGNIDVNVKVKITSEGIQDFINRDGKAHTIIKFGANVGDEYNLTKSGGQTLKRTVTQKSTTDDFSYGFMNIKTMTTEQASSYPGVKNIVYKTNHKYGLVFAEIQFEDGTKINSYVYSQNSN